MPVNAHNLKFSVDFVNSESGDVGLEVRRFALTVLAVPLGTSTCGSRETQPTLMHSITSRASYRSRRPFTGLSRQAPSLRWETRDTQLS